VTEFFRNPEQWYILKNDIIPLLSKNNRPLKIWSCACSSGEEVLSLQFILRNINIHFDLLATDIDRNILNYANIGIYDIRQLKNIEHDSINKYFIKLDSTKYAVKDEYKQNIKFKLFNLLSDEYPKGFDLILCRNVLIYLTEQAKNNILKKLSNSLNNGGVLFVGSTEQIIFPQNYGLESYKTFFYKKV
jgi:chemotaxis protein methyltransferase CheR